MSKTSGNFIQMLFSGKKKWSLLLLLLGGGGIITTTLILTAPNNSSSSSPSSISTTSTTSSASSTSSSNPSSQDLTPPPYEGDDVPTWDLTKPTLSPDSSTFDTKLDATFFSRFQEDYLLAAGGVLIDGAPNSSMNFMAPALRVINTKTGQTIFSFDFSYGSAYETYLKTSTSLHNPDGVFSNIRFAFGGSFVYVGFHFKAQTNSNDVTSKVGGTYIPFVNAVNTRYANIPQNTRDTSNYFGFARISIADNTITALDVSDRFNLLTDLLVNDGKLYAFHQYVDVAVANSKLDFVTLPTLTNDYVPNGTIILFEFAIASNGVITQQKSTLLGSSGNMVFYSFFGQRQGFTTTFFNADGELYFGGTVFTGGISGGAVNKPNLATNINNIKFSFVDSTNLDSRKASLITESEEMIDSLFVYAGLTSITIAFNIQGNFNFTSNKMTDPSLTPFFQFYNNVNQSNVVASNSSNRIKLNNQSYDLVARTKTIFESNFAQGINITLSYFYTLFKEDRVTKALTQVLEFDNVGITVVGIFERQDGFYLSGTILENTSNPTIKKSAAFLRALDNQFATVNELVLDGSEEDFGGGIALNNQAQPVWFVRSRSIDGPFEVFAATNPNKALRTYTVTFN